MLHCDMLFLKQLSRVSHLKGLAQKTEMERETLIITHRATVVPSIVSTKDKSQV